MNVVEPPQLGRAVPEAAIVHPPKGRVPPPRRGRFVAWALIWSLAIVYGSVVVGPLGFHYVPLDSATAWARFMAMPYVVQGSDQQADWMGNLVFLVPLGFAVAGIVWPRRGAALRIAAAIFAFCVCVGFILTVKYFQIFFPPRTVTLNYVFAQSLGSLFGIILYAAPRGWAHRAAHYFSQGDVRAVQIYLAVYAVALLLFMLFPLDFVFHAADLRARLADLPPTLMSWPGGGRSLVIRLILVTLDTAATVPLGVLAAVTWPRLSLGRLIALGFLAMAAIWFVTVFVMSATPYLVAILYRTAGIAIGAGLAWRMRRPDILAAMRLMGRAVPFLVPVYVFAVLYVNRVVTTHWMSPGQVLATLDPRLLLPFWNHYIVSKAQAAESTVVQFITYAPIGVMISLRRNGRPGRAWLAAVAAAMLSLAVEIGRALQPGLSPDFTNIFFACVAAYAAARLMPAIWRFVEADDRAPWTADEAPLASVGLAPADPDTLAPVRFERDAEARTAASPANWIVAVACIALAGAVAVRYPIAPWALVASLVLYGALLWRWPAAWLVAVPAILPVLDLTPWTGWIFVGEPDLFILATVGILAARAPPARRDFVMAGWFGRILLLFIVVYGVNVAMGLARPGPVGGSDNPFLRPDNALRLAKGFVEALALLPFLRARQRRAGDAAELFGWGMLGGLVGVGAVAAIERALFPGLFDFTSDYRIVATFSSMNLGGGHVGAYVAMALPFLVVCAIRSGAAKIAAMLVVALLGGYTLIVTFARTAYAAAMVGVAAAFVGWVLALRGGRRASWATAILPALLVIAVGGVIFAAAFGGTFMSERLETVGPDLGTREGNWTGGLALRDDGAAAAVLGMGLGTYPRIVLEKRDGPRAPTDFVVVRDGDRFALSMRFGSAFFLIQRVPIEPDRRYTLSLRMRTPDGRGRLSALLCENMLLYSDNCQSATLEPGHDGAWNELKATLPSAGMDEHAVLGFLKRPVELSLSDPVPGSVIELEDVRLVDPEGRDVVANGGFTAGLSRWFFSDDDHLVWRIKNQYLMILFEGGVLGLGAFLLLAVGSIVGAGRAALRGELMAAGVAASLVAFLCSGAFDYLLEAPRLAALFYLVCFIGLDGGARKFMTNDNRQRPAEN